MWVMNALSENQDLGEYMIKRKIADAKGVPGSAYRERALREDLIEEDASCDEKLQSWFAIFWRYLEHQRTIGMS